MGSLSKMSGNCELRKKYMPGGVYSAWSSRFNKHTKTHDCELNLSPKKKCKQIKHS